MPVSDEALAAAVQQKFNEVADAGYTPGAEFKENYARVLRPLLEAALPHLEAAHKVEGEGALRLLFGREALEAMEPWLAALVDAVQGDSQAAVEDARRRCFEAANEIVRKQLSEEAE